MKYSSKGKFFGSVTVGERGQVVIPIEVRKSFKIKAGDKLIVLAKPDMEMFSFVTADNFNRFLNDAEQLLSKFRNKTSKES